MLEVKIRKYQNRSIDSAQVIQELIEIAKKVREDKAKGKELGLSPEEEAFEGNLISQIYLILKQK